MSSQLIEARKKRIDYILKMASMENSIRLDSFEEVVKANPHIKPKDVFDSLQWIPFDNFKSKMLRDIGVRERLFNDYIDLLKDCDEVDIQHNKLRVVEVVRQFLMRHPELQEPKK